MNKMKTRRRTELTLVYANGLPSASLLNFDLKVLMQKMKLENAFQNAGLSTKILVNSPEKGILLTIVQDSTEIDSFQVDDSISFHVIEGKLKFSTRKESVILMKGQLLKFNERGIYRITSLIETAFILTIVRSPIKLCKN